MSDTGSVFFHQSYEMPFNADPLHSRKTATETLKEKIVPESLKSDTQKVKVGLALLRSNLNDN